MMYFVERLYQTSEGWKYGVYQYEDRIAAEKMFYKLLAADVDDETKIVSTCILLDSNGNLLMRKTFTHYVTEETSEE